MSPPTVFVCGATGTQGGALIDHLLKLDVKAQAVTRSLNSPAAQNLQKLGVAVAEGDFDNDESVKQNMRDCTSLFLNLMPHSETPTQASSKPADSSRLPKS